MLENKSGICECKQLSRPWTCEQSVLVSPVQIDEEAEQVVAQFNHGLLHVRLEQTSVVDLRWVKHSHVPHRNLQVPAG